jgi:hypothetical protein
MRRRWPSHRSNTEASLAVGGQLRDRGEALPRDTYILVTRAVRLSRSVLARQSIFNVPHDCGNFSKQSRSGISGLLADILGVAL